MKIPADRIPQIKEAIPKLDRPKKRIVELMIDRVVPKHKNEGKTCSIEFYQAPESIEKDESGRVKSVELKNTITGEKTRVPCSLFIYVRNGLYFQSIRALKNVFPDLF